MLWMPVFHTFVEDPSSCAEGPLVPWRVVTYRRHLPLLAAIACLVGMLVVAVVALGVPAGHVRDAAMLHGFVALDRPSVNFETKVVAHLADPLPYAVAGLLCIVVALVRRRGWRALAGTALLLITGASCQALKHLLSQPRIEAWLSVQDQISNASWPSGHSTAAMTLALCAVLVVPPALRAVTALLGGIFAVGVGYAVLVLAWHFPSDVLGGFLLAGFWTSLAVAVLQRVEAPEPAQRPAWEPLVVAGGAATLVAAVVIGQRSDTAALYALERPTLVVGALAIPALALALVTTISAASTRGVPQAR
jgi:membrane-associated phospholipid phosphatase